MLEIKNLSVFYGKSKALEDISLSFEKGKFYAIIGRNSSGKSTLVHCLSSLIGYKGKILLDGRCLSDFSPKERAVKISFLPQHVPSVPFTAEELVCFGRNPHDDIKSGGGDIAKKAINDVGIAHLVGKKVNGLSGGERQLCYFAMNLCQNTDIMILDEPTSNLDIEHESKILSLSKRRCKDGTTVICVIHNLSEAVKYADGVIILEGGKCVFSGDRNECLEKGIIEKNFGVKRFDSGGEIFFSVCR